MRKKKLAKKAGKSKAVKAKKTKAAVKKKMPVMTRVQKPLKKTFKSVGKVTHFYDKINVAVLKLSNTLKVGDKLKLVGKKGEFEQLVSSIQIEHQPVPVARKGADIGLKVDKPVKVDKTAYLAK